LHTNGFEIEKEYLFLEKILVIIIL